MRALMHCSAVAAVAVPAAAVCFAYAQAYTSPLLCTNRTQQKKYAHRSRRRRRRASLIQLSHGVARECLVCLWRICVHTNIYN